MEELEITRSRIVQNEQQRSLAESQAVNAEKEARRNLEQQLQQVQQQYLAGTQAVQAERQAKGDIEQQLQQVRSELTAKTAEAGKADEAFKEMEGQFVRAQTELTIVKADLDSAHGSRAERAAEKAADPVLQARIQKLEAELGETITDYESMTKATIEHEKEREQMESMIDNLRDKVENLESQLNDEKFNALGAKSPGNSSDRGGGMGTSAAVLRSEFRKMMKDARTEHTKALRAEQDERRRLEATVRALKKDQLQSRAAAK